MWIVLIYEFNQIHFAYTDTLDCIDVKVDDDDTAMHNYQPKEEALTFDVQWAITGHFKNMNIFIN